MQGLVRIDHLVRMEHLVRIDLTTLTLSERDKRSQNKLQLM